MNLFWLVLLAVIAYVLYRLFRSSNTSSPKEVGRLKGPGEYDAPIVGESHYQRVLEEICVGRSEEGVEKYVDATLVLEDSNPHDNMAVRIDIEGKTVGYLSRDDARSYRQRLKEDGHPSLTGVCSAVIRGGWDRGGGDVGHFGVFLDLPIDYNESYDSQRPEKTVEKDIYNSTVLTFDVGNPNIKELPECKVNDYVNLWKPSMNPKKISIFRSGTVGGEGKIGFVPNRYFDVISSHVDKGLRIDASIIELAHDKCKIRCKLVSKQELEAEKEKELKSHMKKLTKPYSPRKPIVFVFNAKENHGIQIGEKLKFHFEKSDFYINNPHQWHIQILDSKGNVVGTKSDENSKILEKILKTHFNSYDFDIEVLSTGKACEGYEWYKFPVKVEAKPIKV